MSEFRMDYAQLIVDSRRRMFGEQEEVTATLSAAIERIKQLEEEQEHGVAAFQAAVSRLEEMQHAFDVVNEDHKEQHQWLYAIWMAFLAEEETHELGEVLKRMNAWMFERMEARDDDGIAPS